MHTIHPTPKEENKEIDDIIQALTIGAENRIVYRAILLLAEYYSYFLR